MSLLIKLIQIALLAVGALGRQDDVITPRDTIADIACSPATRPYVFTDYTASFVSPNYPANYPNNAVCYWLILSQEPGGFVSLDFSELMTEASYDVLNIYDGNTTSSPILTGFDGSWSPPPKGVMSTQPSMLVVFTSDASIVDKGFIATFTSTPWFEVKDPCSSLSRPLLVSNGAGEISSPNFNNNYYNYANCQWLIESQVAGGVVALDFLNFWTENFVDSVYLYDGPTTSSALITTLNGPTTTTGWRTTQMYMLVRFTSNANNVRSGWRATYSSQSAP